MVAGSLLGHRAGVVAGIALVLVGGLVFLVHDDQADVAQRREYGRARSHAHPCLATAQAVPLVVALALAQGRVHHGHDVAEPGLEAPHGLGRERDLGHEHDRPAPRRQRRLHRPQVHLGLARAGHAMKQELAVTGGGQGRQDRVQGRLLIGRQRRREASRGPDPVLRGAAAGGGGAQLHEATALEAADAVQAPGGGRGPLPRRLEGGEELALPSRQRPGAGRRRAIVGQRLVSRLGEPSNQHVVRSHSAGRARREQQPERPGRG